jgi:hypothetical protein
MYLAAARITSSIAIIDHKLYWSVVSDIDEARYLTAILNSDVLTQLVRPMQACGEHNPRDFDKYIFRLPIPLYDPDIGVHRQLVTLADKPKRLQLRQRSQLGCHSRHNDDVSAMPLLVAA